MANNHITVGTSSPRGQDFRNMIQQGVAFRNALQQFARSMPQYGTDAAGYTAIEGDFGLAAGLGSVLAPLVGSASGNMMGTGTDTSLAQLLDRLG